MDHHLQLLLPTTATIHLRPLLSPSDYQSPTSNNHHCHFRPPPWSPNIIYDHYSPTSHQHHLLSPTTHLSSPLSLTTISCHNWLPISNHCHHHWHPPPITTFIVDHTSTTISNYQRFLLTSTTVAKSALNFWSGQYI